MQPRIHLGPVSFYRAKVGNYKIHNLSYLKVLSGGDYRDVDDDEPINDSFVSGGGGGGLPPDRSFFVEDPSFATEEADIPEDDPNIGLNPSSQPNNPNIGSQPTGPNLGSQPTGPNLGSQPTGPNIGSQPTGPNIGSQPTGPNVGTSTSSQNHDPNVGTNNRYQSNTFTGERSKYVLSFKSRLKILFHD